MARAMGTKRSTDFFIEILKKSLLFDKINLETAKILLLYLTYKELRQLTAMTFKFSNTTLYECSTLPIRN